MLGDPAQVGLAEPVVAEDLTLQFCEIAVSDGAHRHGTGILVDVAARPVLERTLRASMQQVHGAAVAIVLDDTEVDRALLHPPAAVGISRARDFARTLDGAPVKHRAQPRLKIRATETLETLAIFPHPRDRGRQQLLALLRGLQARIAEVDAADDARPEFPAQPDQLDSVALARGRSHDPYIAGPTRFCVTISHAPGKRVSRPGVVKRLGSCGQSFPSLCCLRVGPNAREFTSFSAETPPTFRF